MYPNMSNTSQIILPDSQTPERLIRGISSTPNVFTQRLSSGVLIRQDFQAVCRLVLFSHDYEDWPYSTPVGTAFVVIYEGKPFGITCAHVRQEPYTWQQLVITNRKKGTHETPLKRAYVPSELKRDAVD